jgi:hypothetical protein
LINLSSIIVTTLTLAGGTQNGSNVRDRQIAELERQIEGRDQVIGELTVANRVLEKLSTQSR